MLQELNNVAQFLNGYTIKLINNTRRNFPVSISILNNLMKFLKELPRVLEDFHEDSFLSQGFESTVLKASPVELCSIAKIDTLDRYRIDSVSVKN